MTLHILFTFKHFFTVKNELQLENYSVQEMQAEEKLNADGGKIFEKFFKFEWNGWFDGDPSSDSWSISILGFKVAGN